MKQTILKKFNTRAEAEVFRKFMHNQANDPSFDSALNLRYRILGKRRFVEETRRLGGLNEKDKVLHNKLRKMAGY